VGGQCQESHIPSEHIPSETDIRLAGERLISAYGPEAWFVASDLAIAAARAGNSSAAELCSRIAQAIEEMGEVRQLQ